MKIKNNIFLFIFPTTIFIIAIFSFVYSAINHIELESKENINKSLTAVLHTTQEALNLWAEEQLKEVFYAAESEKIRKLTASLLAITQSNDEQIVAAKQIAITTKLKGLILDEFSFAHYENFAIISANRITLSSMHNEQIGHESIINVQRKYYLDRVFSGESIFIPTVSFEQSVITQEDKTAHRAYAIFIAAPIYNKQGKVIAAIALGIDPGENFTRILQLGQIGKSGETYAFDKAGVLITESRFEQHLQTAGEIAEKDTSIMSIRITDPGTNLLSTPQLAIEKSKRPLTLMAEKAIAGDFSKQLESYSDYRGVPVFGAWLWDKTLDIGIATEIDAKEALLPHDRTKKTVFIIFCFIILLSLCLMSLFIWMKEKENKILNKHRNQLEDLVKQRTLALEQANDALQKLSDTDPLTQIANRRLYNKTLKSAVKSAVRNKLPLSLLIIDIDYFKAFNDHYGHDIGDTALKDVATILAKALPRKTDFVARFGGEEFAVILPNTEQQGAYYVAERLRLNIELAKIKHDFSKIGNTLTVSIGIANLIKDNLAKNDMGLIEIRLFKDADNALYQAKEQGRNQCQYL